MMCRAVGWLLLASALAALAFEGTNWLASGEWRVFAAGELWFMLDNESLNLVQAVTQRYLHPAVWDPVAIELLQWPAWALFGAPAILLLVLCRRRRRRVGDGPEDEAVPARDRSG